MHPSSIALVPITTFVWARMLPTKSPFEPTVTVSATAQMMFCERAPPIKVISTAAAWTRVPAIWKIQVSPGPPAIVMPVEMVTPVVHLYKPGVRIEPPMRPAFRLMKSGSGLFEASVYAANISATATVKVPGVGKASVAPIKRPFTCVEVQNCPLGS